MGRDSRIHLKHETRSCMVSILYAIRAKRKLPRKRIGAGRKQTAEDDEVSADTGEAREHTDTGAEKCLINEKPAEVAAGRQDKEAEKNLATKSSFTSRIKAMIYEERPKKGGSHRRSFSCPSWARPKGSDFSTHSESTAGFNFELDMEDKGKRCADENPCRSSTSGPLLPDTTDESANKNKMCELCAAKLSRSAWKRSEANQEVRHSVESNSFIEDDIIDSERFGEDGSVQDLNELLDALDVVGPRKEYFLKVLEDPGTPLLQYLHSREALKSKVGLTKSASFPLPGSVGRIVLESTNNGSKHGSALDASEKKKFHVCHSPQYSAKLAGTMVERKEVGTSEPVLGRNRSFNGLPSCTPRGLKIEHENRPVINRFKQLKKKISRAIRESRKEKQQPVMDSVTQIVPYDRTTSKIMLEETGNWQKNVDTKDGGSVSCEVDQSNLFLQKHSENPRFRRATTFTDSMDRYSRLFECTLKKMARYQFAEKSTLRAENVPTPGKSSNKTLERLASLPNLRAQSTLLIDSYQSPEREPLKTFEGHAGMTETESLDEKKPLDSSVDLESLKQLDAAEERATVNDLEEHGESPAQSENLNADRVTSDCQDNLESTSVPAHSEPSPPHVSETNSEEITASPPQLSTVEADSLASKDEKIIMVDNAVDIHEVESPRKQWHRKLLHTQVDTKHVCEFNYVKDILELSGFTADKLLGTWHSPGQPVDPSVIEKVEGFPLTELNCSEDEVRSCNRLLMFDLTNEVLIEIHERSACYFPKPLTCRSHISPMPVEYHVLGEAWTKVKWYLSWRPESYQSLDDAVGRDLDRGDGWMNLQFDAECAGLEIEDSLFDDLIDEMLYDDLLED